MALIEDCLARLRRSPAADPAKFVRYSLWLSAACLEVGDPARAAVALADALANGRGNVDLESRATRLFELARAHAAAGRTELAIRHSDRALSMYELAEDNEALRDAHLAYAQSLLDASDADGAAEHLAAARAMARDGGGGIDGTLAVEEARLALLSGDTATAADRARVAVETLGAATDAQRIGDAYLVLARVQDSLGEIERAEQAYAAAISAFERAGDRRALSRAHRYHGKFLKRLGRSEAALEAFERASDLAPSTAAGVPAAELLQHTNCRIASPRGHLYAGPMEMDASLLIGLERYDEAEDALRASLRRAQAADDRAEVSRALEALGVVATRRGNDDQALDFFRQAVSAGGYPDPVERSELYYELARLTSAAGDPAAAAKLLQGCLERIRRDSPDALDAIARYSYVLSYAYTDAGDYAAAAAVLARVLREGGEEIGLDLRATVFYALGRLHNALGQYQLALQYCRSCLEIRIRQGRSYIVGDTHMHVASVLLSLGEIEEAAEHLVEARAWWQQPRPDR